MSDSVSFRVSELRSILYATKFTFEDNPLPAEYRTVWWFDTDSNVSGNERRRITPTSRHEEEIKEVYLVGEDILNTLDALNIPTPIFTDRQIYTVAKSPVVSVVTKGQLHKTVALEPLRFYAIPEQPGNQRFTAFARLATQAAYDWFDEVLREDPSLLQEQPYRSIGQSLFWWTLTSVDGRSSRPIGVTKASSEYLMDAHYHALIGGAWNTRGLYNSMSVDRGWKRPKHLI